MKWNKSDSELGDTRIIEKFLILPTRINGEVRWLERAKIKQCFSSKEIGETGYKKYWKNFEWID